MGFEVGGWESAGFFLSSGGRFRLWVPPGTRTDPKWGIAIRCDVSPRGSLAILNAIPTIRLGEQGHIVYPARR